VNVETRKNAAQGTSQRTLALAVCAALLALGTQACVTSAEGDLMKKDLEALKETQRLDREAATTERQRLKDESAGKARELQEMLDSLNRAARKSGADLSVDLDKARDDIKALRGALEEAQHRLDAIEAMQAEHHKKLEGFVSEKEAAAKKLVAAEHPTDKAAIYALALKKLDAGDAPRARELLGEFLSKFPSDQLASNAQYWLGETWYAEKKYNDAIVEFQKVLKEHKGSEKVPDALLKIGLSFQSQGDCEKALLFLEEVAQAHKGTPAAKVAKERAADCRKKK
jgi:tol-pal system protein YbgF